MRSEFFLHCADSNLAGFRRLVARMHFRDVLWWGVAASLLVGCSRWLFSSNYSNSTAWEPLRIMTKEEQNYLKNEAESLLKEWKGILAADESTGTQEVRD